MSYNNQYGGRYGQSNPYDQRDVEANPYDSDTALNNNNYGQRQPAGLPSRPAGNRPYAQAQGSNVEMQSLLAGPGASRAPGGATMSPPEILNSCRSIDMQIDELSERLSQLRNQQRTFLQAPNPNAATIDGLSTQIMDSYRGLGAQLKKVKSQPQSGNNLCAAQVGKVDRRLKSAIQDFQRVDSDFRGQVREQQARQYRIVRPDASESEVREAVEDGGGQVFQQALMQSDRRGQAQSALTSVRQRHDAIQKIEQDMMQLAQLFQDLDNIVMEQEPMVQNIEQKAEETVEHVDKGLIEMDGAIVKARSARKKKWMCLGLSIVIVIVIIIIILIVLKVLGVFK